MNLLFKKLLIAIGLVMLPVALQADQNIQQISSIEDLSQEEQQQIMEAMMMRKMVADVLKDLILSNKMTVDWLLQNYIQEAEKGMEKIMHVVQIHAKNRWNLLLGSLAGEFGIQDIQGKNEFIADATTWLTQVIPSEFEKWVYFSAHAGLIRRK